MMIGTIRGVDGAILGQHSIDPTAPGGMQGQLGRIARAHMGEAGMPAPPASPNAGASVPSVPPHTVMLRFQMTLPGGYTQMVTRAIPMPPGTGIPAGVYVRVG